MIRDKRTGDSLQYAFIEFENQKDCEQAYFKMQGVLIDDHRIHVDFSQSVSKLSENWRNATVTKRRQRGGFGGVDDLEQKRQYRDTEDAPSYEDDDSYNMVFDKSRKSKDQPPSAAGPPPRNYRDRSPRRDRSRDKYRRRSYSRSPRRDSRRDRDRRDDRRRDDRYDRRR